MSSRVQRIFYQRTIFDTILSDSYTTPEVLDSISKPPAVINFTLKLLSWVLSFRGGKLLQLHLRWLRPYHISLIFAPGGPRVFIPEQPARDPVEMTSEVGPRTYFLAFQRHAFRCIKHVYVYVSDIRIWALLMAEGSEALLRLDLHSCDYLSVCSTIQTVH